MSKVSSIKEYHEALVRNGIYMPPYASRCITTAYMDKVRAGTVWCPRYVDLKLRPCPHPPVKRVIFRAVTYELNRRGIDFGISSEDHVCIQWLLACLSTINEDHEVFSKNYMPSAEHSRYSKVKPKNTISNHDGFFNNLPVKELKSKGKKTRVQLPFKEVRGGWQFGMSHENPDVRQVR